MSSSSRSRTSTDSSSMAITPPSGKESSSTTNSILIDTVNREQVDASTFNQKLDYDMNNSRSTASISLHRGLFDNQRGGQLNGTKVYNNPVPNEKPNNLQVNLKDISNAPKIDNGLP